MVSSMTEFEENVIQYWKYYLALEKNFIETERYVEFDYVNNGKTYSMEFMKLYQAVCSEIDVIGKALAQKCDSTFIPTKETGINEWWFFISSHNTGIQDEICDFRGTNQLTPWRKFYVTENQGTGKKYILNDATSPKGKTPQWWNEYNNVKHNRSGKTGKTSNYMKANFRNVLNSFAALYILETKLLTKCFDKNVDNALSEKLESSLFENGQMFYTCILAINR